MSELRLSNIFRMFQCYESSRVKLYELVRNTDPLYTAALVYLLTNVSVKKKAKVFIPDNLDLSFATASDVVSGIRTKVICNTENGTKITENKKDADIYIIEKNITFSLEQNEVINQTVPTAEHLSAITLKGNGCGPGGGGKNGAGVGKAMNNVGSDDDITLLAFINEIKFYYQNTQQRSQWFKLMSNNFTSKLFHRFVQNLNDLLYADNKRWNRNETTTVSPESEIKKLLDYYRRLNYRNLVDDNMDPKTFRNIIRKSPKRIDELPLNLLASYIVQPLYNGFRIIIHSDSILTKCYNRHGELMRNFLSRNHIESHATFEALILPTTHQNKLRSWRYWPYRNGYKIIVVDVFRINLHMLTDLPFWERVKYLELIKGENVVPSPITSIDDLNRHQHQTDLFSPIRGILLRERNHNCESAAIEYRFNINFYYNYQSDSMCQINSSDTTIRQIHYSNFINLDMARYRTTVIVYSDDVKWYYVCKFHPALYQFVHIGRIEKMLNDRQEVRYQDERVYVINSKNAVKGVAYMRVYYNHPNTRKIVGYDYKKTASFYDLPCIGAKNDLFKFYGEDQ